MTRRTIVALAAAVAVVSALAIAAFRYGFEKETRAVDTGWGPEARGNPYLAAERLWRRLGVEVETVSRGAALGELPQPGTTLLVPVERRSLELRVPELVEWVRSGGNLVVAANAGASGAAAEDLLLDSLDVHRSPADGLDPSARSQVAWPGRPALSGRLVGGLLLNEGRRKKAAWRIPAGSEAMVLHYREGRGSLTVLASAAFLRSDLIGEDDNAMLAWLLVAEAAGGKAVTLVVSDDAPGLLAVIWRARPAAFLGVLCLLAALVWRGASRLGPVFPAGDPPRRSLREHVEATGRFLWRARRGGALLAAVRGALERDLMRRHPSWRRLAPDELRRRAAQFFAPGEPRYLREAPSERTPARLPEKHFVESVAAMERVRRTL